MCIAILLGLYLLGMSISDSFILHIFLHVVDIIAIL